MDRPKAIEHSDNCDWHLDQYDFECTCGKSAAYLYSVNQKLRAENALLREALEDSQSEQRRRSPQKQDRWPPSMTPSQIEDEIDRRCGCLGRYECNCVSIFNGACIDAWFKHNSQETTHDR